VRPIPEPSRALKRPAPRLALLVFLAGLAILFNLRPLYNWDLVGYVGAVLEWETPGAAALHARTYGLLARDLPPAAFRELLQRLPYTRVVARDPEAFVEQLPFYRVKVGYVALLAGLRAIGMDLHRAVALVSALSTVGCLAILFLWLEGSVGSGRAAWMAAAVGLSPPLIALGRLATPDALACLLVFAASWQLGVGHRNLAVGLGTAAVTVRPDTLVFIGLLALTWAWQAPRAGDRGRGVLLGALALAAYWGETHWAHAYPWTVLFHHTFTGWLDDPRHFHGGVTPGLYLRVVAGELPHLQSSVLTLVAAWLGLVAGLGGRLTRQWARGVGSAILPWSGLPSSALPSSALPPAALLPAALAAVALHFLLFPSLADRFFVPQGLLVLVAVVAMLGEIETAAGP